MGASRQPTLPISVSTNRNPTLPLTSGDIYVYLGGGGGGRGEGYCWCFVVVFGMRSAWCVVSIVTMSVLRVRFMVVVLCILRECSAGTC